LLEVVDLGGDASRHGKVGLEEIRIQLQVVAVQLFVVHAFHDALKVLRDGIEKTIGVVEEGGAQVKVLHCDALAQVVRCQIVKLLFVLERANVNEISDVLRKLRSVLFVLGFAHVAVFEVVVRLRHRRVKHLETVYEVVLREDGPRAC